MLTNYINLTILRLSLVEQSKYINNREVPHEVVVEELKIMTPEEKAKERLLKFQQAKAKAEQAKNHSSFPKEEVPEFKTCVLSKDKPRIIRLIGNSPLMRESVYDGLIVKRAFVKTDDDKWTTIILSDDRDNPVNKLWRTIIGKYTYDKENKTKIYANKGKPSFERFIRNGKKPEDCLASEKGMMTDTFYLFNCLDRTDDWCKENKHTKLLCWDSTTKEVDGKTVEYPTYGIKPSLYNNIFDEQCTALNRMYDEFDVVVKRLSKKLGDSWIQVFSPEEKSKISQIGLDPNKVTMNYLSEEEESYEKYKLEDIPFVSRPTSVGYVLRVLGKLIKACDLDFGTNLYEEFVEYAEKEKKEWEAKKAETKETESSEDTSTEVESEDEVTEETTSSETPSFDSMETVETESSDDEELPSEVEEPTPTVTKKVVKTARFDPLALKTVFPYIDKLNEHELSEIVGYDETTKKLKFNSDSICECPCGMELPEDYTSCYKCGSQFE